MSIKRSLTEEPDQPKKLKEQNRVLKQENMELRAKSKLNDTPASRDRKNRKDIESLEVETKSSQLINHIEFTELTDQNFQFETAREAV